MALREDRSASFIIRIWQEGRVDPAECIWRGSIENVRSGEKVYFMDLPGVSTYLARQLRELGIDTGTERIGTPPTFEP